jgi:hypothetical protein
VEELLTQPVAPTASSDEGESRDGLAASIASYDRVRPGYPPELFDDLELLTD